VPADASESWTAQTPNYSTFFNGIGRYEMLELVLLCTTTAVAHFIMSFFQTFLHYRLGHRKLGGHFFRNHVFFHHAYYAKDHLVSARYLADEGNNTPFFLIPTIVVALLSYFVVPIDLFVALIVGMSASFYAHVYLDKQYHVAGSWLGRFAWFRRKQQLHFVHHRHANSNFAVIDYFWDRLLGTYRGVEAENHDLRQSGRLGTGRT
jgi:sterol desaturase/sphingolipid hydroxylase (fatty acid hydroxylase superfamily)